MRLTILSRLLVLLAIVYLSFWSFRSCTKKTSRTNVAEITTQQESVIQSPINTNCKCAIEKITDRAGGNNLDESNESLEVESSVNLETRIKKLISTKINLSGQYSNSDKKIRETYWEVVGDNPQITQRANIYRTIACAYYEIVCQDNTLTARERREELNKIINGFEKNIGEIARQGNPN